MSLPGADELFRTTGGGMGLQPSSPAERRRKANGEPRVPAPAGESDPSGQTPSSAGREEHAAADADGGDSRGRPAGPADGERRAEQPPAAPAAEPGRERHDEKITVYVSAEELMDLEHARLVLRGEHGLAVDRGRIVREAVAVVLADLESRGDASILVRRLRGR
ncbi:hypothetical protein [Streptomyces sp. SH5]|uniref:hypothetical protein n=1 Tax=Streptomyces sp. SH5 TaxID=3041765 RepID=UPI0024782077|nr:hypothetical protein [Streptomyces sp. SH5]WGP14414.1 hypothetical protein QFA72_06190 [Streptomyces sp. SH5]